MRELLRDPAGRETDRANAAGVPLRLEECTDARPAWLPVLDRGTSLIRNNPRVWQEYIDKGHTGQLASSFEDQVPVHGECAPLHTIT